ncbi:hypothetical protein EJ06DRAFT_519832 [Trichodelitschia bisporula]|uniref:Uncharacterized protein n=1 Tax=Trichodelitschia bisporula TaxID=703511 RepID=A0A6G1I434_9PEZI|nr:hypothetical protein EJ06DRAFT_519832 [Trichodelitschia bisporula]
MPSKRRIYRFLRRNATLKPRLLADHLKSAQARELSRAAAADAERLRMGEKFVKEALKLASARRIEECQPGFRHAGSSSGGRVGVREATQTEQDSNLDVEFEVVGGRRLRPLGNEQDVDEESVQMTAPEHSDDEWCKVQYGECLTSESCLQADEATRRHEWKLVATASNELDELHVIALRASAPEDACVRIPDASTSFGLGKSQQANVVRQWLALTNMFGEASSRSRRKRSISSIDSQTRPASPSKNKRVKRHRRNDSDQLTEELDEHLSQSVEPEPQPKNGNVPETQTGNNPPQTQSSLGVPPRRRVRFSDPGPNLLENVTVNVTTTTTTSTQESESYTPVGSPAGNVVYPALPSLNDRTQALKVRKTRHSLPATFNGQSDRLVENVQFTPLRQVLDTRLTRRLKRSHLSEEVNIIEHHKRQDARRDHELEQLHDQIAEKNRTLDQLIFELESRRQMGIELGADESQKDEKLKTLEAELANLKSELDTLRDQRTLARIRESPEFMDVDTQAQDMDDDDDDELVFVEPEDINVSQEDMTPSTSFNGIVRSAPLSASQMSIPDPTHEEEIKRFEDALTALNRELSDAHSAIRITNIELQSLGFAGPEASANDVLVAIRNAFRQARLEAEELIPEQSPNLVENGDFLRLLTDNVRGLLHQIREQLDTIDKHEQMEALLRGQYNGILDKLADVDKRNQNLEKRYLKLDREHDEKVREFVELEQQYVSLSKTVEEKENELESHSSHIQELRGLVQGRDATISELQKESEELNSNLMLTVRKNEGQAQEIQRLEQKIAELEETIVVRTAELENELRCRQLAESELDEQQSEISTLQVKLELAQTELETTRNELAETKISLADEREEHLAAEADIVEKMNAIEAHQAEISKLQSENTVLREEIEEVRSLAAAERRQRETAETEIEERNIQVAELNHKLHDEGLRSNELRMKLFEVQNERKTLTDLQTATAERVNQLENDLTAEIAHREEAENLITLRDESIAELEDKYSKLDTAMVELLSAKDALLADHENRTAELEEAMAAAEEQYKSELGARDSVIESLEADITDLSELAELRKRQMEELEAQHAQLIQAKDNEMSERNMRIASLASELAEAKAEITRQAAESATLEQRLQARTTELHELQNETNETIASLHRELSARTHRIQELEATAAHTAHETDVMIQGKNLRIQGLELVVAARESDVRSLEGQVEALRKALRENVDAGAAAARAMAEIAQAAANRALEVGSQFAEGERDALRVAEEGVENARREREERRAATEVRIATPVRATVLRNGDASAGATQNGGSPSVVSWIRGFKRRSRRTYDSGIGVGSEEERESEMTEVEAVASQ